MAARPRPRLPADYLTRAATPVRPGAKHGALPRTTRRRSKRKRRRRFQPRRSAFTPAASQEAIAQSCENTRFGLDWFGWWLLGTRQGGSRIPSRAGHCWQGGGGSSSECASGPQQMRLRNRCWFSCCFPLLSWEYCREHRRNVSSRSCHT